MLKLLVVGLYSLVCKKRERERGAGDKSKAVRRWKGELISESFVIRDLFVITFPLGVERE